ncbi:MAG: DUF2087 domain-containing protein [Burkholderiales bacterium]|nr:DUF2087 domain-containing protein [Burkholderiales bacterium]
MLARSAGYRHYQTLKANPPSLLVAEAAMPPTETFATGISLPRGSTVPMPLRRLLSCFDTQGRLMRWPNKYAAQQTAIWGLWSRLPAQRELVNAKLLWRTVDCRVYRKEQRRPDEATRAFLALLFRHTHSAKACSQALNSRLPGVGRGPAPSDFEGTATLVTAHAGITGGKWALKTENKHGGGGPGRYVW